MKEFLVPAPPLKADALNAVVDMVKARIDAGKVCGILVICLGEIKEDDTAEVFYRTMVPADMLDFLDEGMHNALTQLETAYEVTAAELRSERQRGLKRE